MRQMRISVSNYVSVAKPQQFGKTGDGQLSASEAYAASLQPRTPYAYGPVSS